MEKKSRNPVHIILDFSKKQKLFFIISSFLSLMLVYYVVRITGGVKYVYAHIMYIPIIFAGLLLGWKWGLVISIFAGIILGPFMPLDTLARISQELHNWVIRAIIFALVGFITGYIADLLRKDKDIISNAYAKNVFTNIPNLNMIDKLDLQKYKDKNLLAITIILNNHKDVYQTVGLDNFHKLLENLYLSIKNEISNVIVVIQAESNKLWIIKESNDPEEDVKNIYRFISKPVKLENISVYVDFTLGAALMEKLHDKETLIHYINKSDNAALDAIKTNLVYKMHSSNMENKKYDFSLLADFNDALDNDKIELVFQPKIDLKEDKIHSFEALLRWEHPKYGPIPPASIIPLVERTHLIHKLTYRVIEKSIMKILEFKQEKIDISISINISAINLSNPSFFKNAMKIIHKYKFNARALEFEITESSLMNNPQQITSTLYKFRKQGISISIDDFGVGYSSLSYMDKLPVSILKIDKSFIDNILISETSKYIVKGTIDMAHNLGLKVVAEGVEEEEMVKILKDFGCDYGQGYFFAKPIPSNLTIAKYKKYNGK